MDFEEAIPYKRPYGVSYKLMAEGKRVGVAHPDRTVDKNGTAGPLQGYFASSDSTRWDGYIAINEAGEYGLPSK